ncbi:kinesin-like protein KIN-10B isoform X2 [Phragmites australis]|uniref:kinesin-like protein KIN-10B isoform X2 n=1 Tax=Phragmites australis TaxID=29695 RepID=UPI002D77694A|nr:kinesin-like protein KIN-10B isoform X2 [Phragmites australis]
MPRCECDAKLKKASSSTHRKFKNRPLPPPLTLPAPRPYQGRRRQLTESEEMEAAAAPNSSHSRRISPAAPVRVVARICPGGGGGGSFQVAAHVSDAADSSSAVVSLLPIHEGAPATPGPGAPPQRKYHEYMLDCCYLKSDSYHHIFHSEVKPLVDATFRGNNACVVTCGATAKTHLIMGSQGQPGLLTMAMAQILHLSKPIDALVSVSSYQVLQDNHVFDLLEPKDNEVLVLEDADGRTNLKGLSRVDVKSTEEFADLCYCGSDNLKHPAKASNQLQTRGGHQGFIIYISRFDQQGKECAVAKMNFLDLAGYVDPKQKNNGGGLALPNCNKSMYALMNVVQALNSNQKFIPYRQSKLTRILQDSLCKTNGAVLIACLDEVCSIDAVSTLSLASRSSQVVNQQCYNLSSGTRSSSKSNVNLASAKNLSRSLLPSIHQPSSVLEKHGGTQFNNSAVKASRTLTANKRSEVTMQSAQKPRSSAFASTNMKKTHVKPVLSGRKLFCPGPNSSKEDKIVAAPAPTVVTKTEKLQSSLGMEIQAPLPAEGCGEIEKVIDVVSSEMQELVPCSMQELISSSVQEEDYSSSDLHAEHSCTTLDDLIEKTPVGAIQSSPKLSDRLKEISNSLKLLSTRPVSVTNHKIDMVRAQHFNTDLPEPKTPAIHLKFGHAEDSHELLKARSTGIQKSLAQECLAFLNSANKEQLKRLKGIGEKRASHILELREESPELFKEIDDLKNIIGMNKTQIKNMISGMIVDS